MKGKNFKLREEEYKAMEGMTEKQAGQFIKGLCKYAFESEPFETKDAKLASAYAYAKVSLDRTRESRENGKKGGIVIAERKRKAKQEVQKSIGLDMLLNGLLVSVAESSTENARKK